MSKKKHLFNSGVKLKNLIDNYFEYIKGEQEEIKSETKNVKAAPIRQSEPATIAGLAFYLGFTSHEAFEEYEANGKYADQIKRARLHIMADYEKKLHATSSTGAIFALKSMGWNERAEKLVDEAVNTVLKVEIIQSGPLLASSEKEVVL